MNGINPGAYEGDIVDRLRNWRGLHLAHSGDLFEEAAAEITQLREALRRLAEQDATLSVQGGNVIVEMDVVLTKEEREAVKFAYARLTADSKYEAVADTLRSLLERTATTKE